MNSVYVTGDTHIPIDIRKLGSKVWKEGRTLSKSDYLIVLGDFGLLWKDEPDAEELVWTEWLNKKKWTTLWIDGNHENFNRIKVLPQVEMFGSTVGKVSDSIYHLNRGHVYTIQDKTFFCMGGAKSIDKSSRRDQISWWPEEEPSKAEMDFALDNLEKYGNKVDYILTHTLPTKIVQELFVLNNLSFFYEEKDPLWKFLQHVYDTVNCKLWFCGHWHLNAFIDKCALLYEDIIKVV